MPDEVAVVAEFCKTNLDLENVIMSDEYGYSSLPLCVIDAVFSIGVNYASTENTVDRFCEHFQVNKTSLTKLPDISEQLSISKFLQINSEHGIEGMARNVYKNLQRTSTQNGILKAEAVVKFSEILIQFGVDYLQHVEKILGNTNFESAVTKIPGQRSGLSIRYFYMLAGAENYVKPDRMVTRFIKSAIGRYPGVDESHQIIVGACEILSKQFPALNPRALDHQIWLYQREQ
ncbi:MAG TPA: hypothetical protein VNA23_08845 [Anaerolineales bacterium]|nr:hypothetical protein [Anaerolineales bacterium]